MIRWLLFLFTAAGTLFFSSSRFVDPWLVPKWGILAIGMVAWGLVTAVHWVYPFDRCPVRFRSWMEIVLVALVGVEASALLPVGQGDSFGRSLLVRRVALWSKEEFGGRTAAHLALHLDIVGLSVVIIWLVCLARASPIVSFPLYRLVQLLDRTGRMDEAMQLARQLVEKR